MCKKAIYLIFLLIFCLVPSAHAAHIIWVSDWYDERIDGIPPTLEAVLPQHPIFNNVNLNTQNRVDVYDQSVGSGIVSFNSVTDVGSGTLLAKPAGQNWTIIAEWEAGVPFYAATSRTPAGKRLFFRVEPGRFFLTGGGSSGISSVM